ncbi:MAG: Ig-like domain-containing protein [Hespellia sp.]|nr:Ig-like domain-containing protein [Hespellia sp.]
MKKTRGLRERICALVLAILLPLMSVMPNVTMVVSANDVTDVETDENLGDTSEGEVSGPTKRAEETEVTFTVKDGSSNVLLSGATISLNTSVDVTDNNDGSYTATLEQNKEYTYSISKAGYNTKTDGTINTSTEATLEESVDLTLSAVSIDKNRLELNANGTETITITNYVDSLNYEWSSENTDVASVSSSGGTATVAAVGAGNTKISLVCNGNNVAEIAVTVSKVDPTINFTVTPDSGEASDNTIQFKTVLPSDASGTVNYYKKVGAEFEKITENSDKSGDFAYDYKPDEDVVDSIVFKAEYISNNNIYNNVSSEITGTYDKTVDLGLTKSDKELTYGDADWKAKNLYISGFVDKGTVKGRTLSYSIKTSDPEGAVTLEGSKVTFNKPGTVVFEITAAEKGGYQEASIDFTLTINKAESAIAIDEAAMNIDTVNHKLLIDAKGSKWNDTIETKLAERKEDDGRVLSYTSSEESVASIDPKTGIITPRGVGETKITVNAASNDNYSSSEVSFVISIQKTIDSMDNFTWAVDEDIQGQNGNGKIYNRDEYIYLKGELNSTEKVNSTDAVAIKVKAKLNSANVGSYASCTGESLTENSNSYYKVDVANKDIKIDVSVTARKIYIKIIDCEDLQYGMNGDGKTVTQQIEEKTNLVELTENDGRNPHDPNTGKVGNDVISLDRIKVTLKEKSEEKLFVGDNGTIIIPKNNFDPYAANENYEVIYDTNVGGTAGRLILKKQEVSDTDILNAIVPSGTNYFSITDENNNLKKVWVAGGETNGILKSELHFDIKSDSRFKAYYDSVMVVLDDGTINATEGSLGFKDLKDESIQANIYLLSGKNSDTKTISSNIADIKPDSVNGKNNSFNDVIVVDSTNPIVTFNGLTNAGVATTLANSITFGMFKKSAYSEKIVVTDNKKVDEKTTDSGVQKYQYYIWKLDSEDSRDINKKQLTDKITEININAGWTITDQESIPVAIEEAGKDIKGNYIVLVNAIDNVNNSVVYASNGLVVETNEPTVTLTLEDLKQGCTVYDGQVDYKAVINDTDGFVNSGIQEIVVSVQKDGKEVSGNADDCSDSFKLYPFGEEAKGAKYSLKELKDKSKFEFDGKILDSNNSNNIVIKISAVDKAGNIKKEVTQKLVKIDMVDPEIAVSYDNNDVQNEKFFHNDRTMTITYTERNIDKSQMVFDVTAGEISGTKCTVEKLADYGITAVWGEDSQEGRADTDYTDERTNTLYLTFDKDNDYKILPYITDKAGRTNKGITYAEGTTAAEEFTIDKTFPTLDVKYYVEGSEVSPADIAENRLYKNKTITATATINERNFGKADSFSEEPKQMNLGVSCSNPNPDQEAISDYAAQANTLANWTSNVYERTQTFTFDKDANYTLDFTYRDMAGNTITYAPHYFTVDKTAPNGEIQIHDSVWQSFLQVVTFGFFENTSVGVTMRSDDNTAGVASQQYYKYYPDVEARDDFSALTYDQLEAMGDDEWVSESEFGINPNEQIIPYEKVVDKSGNVTYLNAQTGVVADNVSPEAPQIAITMADPAKGIYNSNVPFHISVTDPTAGETYAGLHSVSYEVRKDGVVTQSGNYDESLSSAASRIKNIERDEVVNAELNNSNTVLIYVKAIDNAGNVSEAEKELKIDITKPTIQVTYDNNSPLNSKYYKDTRTATVTVTDRNFDESAVRFDITNTDGTQPSISGWSSSSDIGVSDNATSTCTVSFAADGDYTFTLNCTDLAGNDSEYTQVDEFTMDKTIPTISVSYDNNSAATPGYYKESRTATVTINEHNFNAADVQAAITASLQSQGVSAPSVNGWSTGGDTHTATINYTADADYTFNISYSDMAGNPAAAYTQDQFTVDKMKPTIDIFDIVDKSANNGTVAPGVKYSDVNYTAAGVKLTLKGDKHSDVAIDGSRSNDTNGESIKLADFAHEEAVDDIYTLTAQVTDKAGNVEEKSVLFSVNRFGSNYRFLQGTKAFLDKYYNNEEADIIVEEINVDTLEANSISYGLDGERAELKKGKDYTVKSSGSEVSWKSYTYTMKKANFEAEGTYSITIDSKDRATNEVNNKVKNKNIEFVIDKTKPTVVITGIEDGKQYNENSRDVEIAVSDNIVLDSLDVYMNDNDNPEKSYSADTIAKAQGAIAYKIDSSNKRQKISAVATDAAGNKADTDISRVLITSNLFVQYYSNKPILFGSIGGVLVLGFGLYLILAKKKNSTSEKA